MGTIICQCCNKTLEHFEDDKVRTLYGICSNCCKEHSEEL